jgi:16S rRNA (cytosine967-C5)-methyltransferase
MPRPRPSSGLSSALRDDRIRAATLEVLADVLEEGQLADRALSRVLRRERKLLSGERRAVAETIYGLLRREAALRQALSRALGSHSIESFPASAVHAALLFGHLQLEGQTPDVSGLPAPLRRALGSLRGALDDQLAEAGGKGSASRLALEHSLPAWLAEQVVREVGASETERLFSALNRRAPLTLRTNLLNTTRDALLDRLAALAVPSHPTLLSPWGVQLEQNPNVFGLEPFREGWFEVQDEGSQLLALLCRARPGQLVVDACAGGGGKTLALAAEMHNRGELWALDVNARRLAELKPRARRAGAHNIRSLVLPERDHDPAAFEKLAGRADAVLVDAPCSGIGALRRNPDARRRLTVEGVEEHAVKQLTILRRMAPLVRPGGLLVYATCSVLRAEDESVAAAFLAREGAFTPVPPRDLLGEELATAIDEPIARSSHPEAAAEGLRSADALRLWPQHHGTDGFFAMAMRRK